MDIIVKSNELFEALLTEYQENGYEFNSKANTFHKSNAEVFWMIEYEFPDYLIYKPVLICKTEEIVKVLESLFPSAPAIVTQITQGYHLAYEFGFEANYLHLKDHNSNRDKGISYKVTSTTDIHTIVEDHLQYMRTIGFKFLEELSNIEGVSNFINSKILEGSLDFFLSKDRQQELKKLVAKREILSGLIAAYLLNIKAKNEIIRRVRLKYNDKGPAIRDMNKIISKFENLTPTASSDLA